MGTLKLYANTHIVPFLAPVISDYLRTYPAAGVEMTGGERMVDLVEEGYDLAVRTVRPPESTLIVRNLSVWKHILCVAPGYFDDHPPIETLADLREHNCLRYAFYPYGDDWHFTGPDGKLATVRISGNLVSNVAGALRTVGLNRLGVFLAPSFVVEEDVEAGRLVEILPAWQPVEFTINALYPHRHQLSSKVRIFIDLMAEHFARHRRWLDLSRAGGDV
jgi:DNA-binding transcriptional LysR family regulator